MRAWHMGKQGMLLEYWKSFYFHCLKLKLCKVCFRKMPDAPGLVILMKFVSETTPRAEEQAQQQRADKHQLLSAVGLCWEEEGSGQF